MDASNCVKGRVVVSKVGNCSSEKFLNVSSKDRLKIRVNATEQKNSIAGDREVQHLVLNHSNFRKSGVPGRVLYYGSDESWLDYPEEVAEMVRGGFREGKAMIEVNMQGRSCVVDLYRMLEIELDTGREKSVAWFDVNGKCFFPKIFVNYSRDFEVVGDNSQEIAVEVKGLDNADNQPCVYKRKRENEDVEVNQVIKAKSLACSSRMNESEMGVARWPKTRVLREEEEEYGGLRDGFLSGLGIAEPGAVITRIHKCTRDGPLDKARYAVFIKQKELMEKARGNSCTTFAWHGTSAESVERILAHGFVMDDESNRFHPHGVGVYLAPVGSSRNSAMLANIDDNGERHAILCRVILGRCEKVTSSHQVLPSTPEFDTGVDDLTNPRWYVVWQAHMNTHILPEYVVSYRSSNHLQVIGGSFVKSAPPSSNVDLADVYNKVMRSLPPTKYDEVRHLISLYKEGKMGKNMFNQQFRSVVGGIVAACRAS